MDFNVNFNRIDIANKEFMTSGAVNIFEAHFEFDESWNGYARTAVFRSGDYGAAVAVVLDATDTCMVPWESLIAEAPLWVGVVGVNGDKKLPTNYVNAGCVAEGAEGGDFAPPPTPSEIEQILAQIGDLRELKTKSKGTLVDAINETYDRAGTGGVEIDPTLSVEGAAADAAAVGSAVKKLTRRDVESVYYFWTNNHTNDVVWAYNQGAPAVIAGSFDDGRPDGLKGAAPPCWVVFGNQSYGKVGMNITDARGMVWAGSVDLRDYSIFAVPVTQTLNLTGVKKGQIPRIASVSHGETVVPTAWEAADLPEADNSLGLSSATVGQTIKVKAVDADGKPTAWEAVDMPSGGGETWEKVADITLTDSVNSVRATFDACSAVYVQLQWGGVADNLGKISILPNNGDTPNTSEGRAAAAEIETGVKAKRGYTIVEIDTRKGSLWNAISYSMSRDDGDFGAITPDAFMNCDIRSGNSFKFSIINNYYFTVRNEPLSNGVTSITVVGAGMAVGTTLRVWGVKK